jgi:hypothetical protein
MDADLVARGSLDVLHHLRMQRQADGRNEKRCWQLVLVEQTKNARQPVDGAVFAA